MVAFTSLRPEVEGRTSAKEEGSSVHRPDIEKLRISRREKGMGKKYSNLISQAPGSLVLPIG